MKSAIYSGIVGHKRFAPQPHQFSYRIFLLALDLDKLPTSKQYWPWFAVDRWALLSFRHRDYLQGAATVTRVSVWEKVQALGGENYAGKVLFLGQVRCLGFYFSPVNFYYCHDTAGKLRYLVAEVSNTPWNERHYYLVDVIDNKPTPKEFHVSPFMDLAMAYIWQISPLGQQVTLRIRNQTEQGCLFSAWLLLERHAFTSKSLIKQLLRTPVMTLKTLAAIYWQAFKLYKKKIPYISYRKKSQEVN